MIRQQKHLLYIIKRETKEFIRYNLKTNTMEKRYRGKGKWNPVSYQYGFFKGLRVSDIEAEDKFIKLIEYVQSWNSNCSSLSTFFDRLSAAMIYEGYITEDVKFSVSRSWRTERIEHLTKPVHKYDKHTRQLLKECRYTVTPDFEQKFFGDDQEFFRKVLDSIRILDCNSARKRELVNFTTDSNYRMKSLIQTHRYDTKSLMKFVVEYLKPFENLDVREGMQLLDDYYTMASEVGRKVKRYPKYLKSMHDIIRANFDSYKREYDEEQFAKLQIPDWEFKDKDFCIVTPKSSKDIVSEGVDLNHCVSSYVDRILEGRTLIIFLREAKQPEDSLITLEVQENQLVQARGSYNRKLTPPEKEFLKKFCDKKKIELVAIEA